MAKRNGNEYWYEGGIRQGCLLNDDGTPDLSYRGKEIYDPATSSWYWLDNVDYGKKAVNKGVLPGIRGRSVGGKTITEP